MITLDQHQGDQHMKSTANKPWEFGFVCELWYIKQMIANKLQTATTSVESISLFSFAVNEKVCSIYMGANCNFSWRCHQGDKLLYSDMVITVTKQVNITDGCGIKGGPHLYIY